MTIVDLTASSENQTPRNVLIVTTGGTVDGTWDPSADTAVQREHSIIPTYLDVIQPADSWRHVPLRTKDSRQMGAPDWQDVLNEICSADEQRILVSHGTYTMRDGAEYAELNAPWGDEPLKKAIFWGAVTPLDGWSKSDVGFQLGFAWAQFDAIENGIYISTQGRTRRPTGTHKDRSRAQFRSSIHQGHEEERDLAVFMTGGTIDSYFDGRLDRIVPNRSSRIPDYFAAAQFDWTVAYMRLAGKDSRELTDKERNLLAQYVAKAGDTPVLVTHGLYTMAETAEHLRNTIDVENQKIILTGSSIPIDHPLSDAPFNLGYACGKYDSVSNGVHIYLWGREFEPNELREYLAQYPEYVAFQEGMRQQETAHMGPLGRNA